MNSRARKLPRKLCRDCGYLMLAVEVVCLACEDRRERQHEELRHLAYLRSIPR